MPGTFVSLFNFYSLINCKNLFIAKNIKGDSKLLYKASGSATCFKLQARLYSIPKARNSKKIKILCMSDAIKVIIGIRNNICS